MDQAVSKFDVFDNKFAEDIYKQKYSYDEKECWADTCKRVVDAVVEDRLPAEDKEAIYKRMLERKFIPAGRYLYASGREMHQVNNCFLFRAEDSREGWADILHKAASSLMLGGGIGIDYSLVRPEGAIIKKTGGLATGPIALMHMINESGRFIMQGGQRRSAIWAGLNWAHKDAMKFLRLKDWPEQLRAIKEKDFTFPMPMELTNISVNYDKPFFEAKDKGDEYANRLWLANCKQAFSKAEPGFAFNYANANDSLRNACTEVTSEDDSDKCNLGTIWMNRHDSLEEFSETCRLATAFLICGGIYSDLPTDKIREVGDKNNRIGVGLGGMHEWLMVKGYGYEVTREMHNWLECYANETDKYAKHYADELGVARPVGVRAIAPTGTIGIIAETTTGIEPLFCKSYKRRYFVADGEGGTSGKWNHQYVVDRVVSRILAKGGKLEDIQDTYA